MKYILILLLTVSSFSFWGQDRLHHDDLGSETNNEVSGWSLADDTIPKTYGPNFNHFTSLQIGIGGLAGENDEKSPIKFGFSTQYFFGIQEKIRVNQLLSLLMEEYYQKTSLVFQQNGDKVFPTDTVHKKERIALHQVGLRLGFRINFDRFGKYRRGSHLGNYLDLMAHGNWAFVKRYVAKEENLATGERVKSIYSNLSYINAIQYGVKARLGFNFFNLYGSYRFSDLIKQNKFKDTYLPRYVFGLEFTVPL